MSLLKTIHVINNDICYNLIFYFYYIFYKNDEKNDEKNIIIINDEKMKSKMKK
jgi:hypothetical protein